MLDAGENYGLEISISAYTKPVWCTAPKSTGTDPRGTPADALACRQVVQAWPAGEVTLRFGLEKKVGVDVKLPVQWIYRELGIVSFLVMRVRQAWGGVSWLACFIWMGFMATR